MSRPPVLDPATARAVVAPVRPDYPVTDVVRRTGGEVSVVYEIRGADGVRPLIVKVYNPRWRSKLVKEVYIYRLLARNGIVHIPRVLHASPFGTPELPWAHTVMTRLAGRPLAEVRDTLTGPDLAAVYRRMGELLAAVHRITQPHWGYLTTRVVDTRPTNTAYMTDQFARRLREFSDFGGDPALARAVARHVARHTHLFAACTTPVLCHNDFHDSNLLVARADPRADMPPRDPPADPAPHTNLPAELAPNDPPPSADVESHDPPTPHNPPAEPAPHNPPPSAHVEPHDPPTPHTNPPAELAPHNPPAHPAPQSDPRADVAPHHPPAGLVAQTDPWGLVAPAGAPHPLHHVRGDSRHGNWRVVGYVDVEGAIAADPLLDVARTDYQALRDDSVRRTAFLEGYGPLPIDWEERLAVYRLHHALELWNWAARTGKPADRTRATSDIEAELAAACTSGPNRRGDPSRR